MLTLATSRGEEIFQQATVADFNGDGIPDLALSINPIGLFGGYERIELGRGDGTSYATQTLMYPQVPRPGNQSTVRASVADLNMDGIEDLIFQVDSQFQTWLGNGDGTFRQQSSGVTNEYYGPLVIGDVNGDGIPDIVYSSDFTNGISNPRTAILEVSLGDGAGNFTQSAYTNNFGPGTTNDVKLADVNGDGVLDILWEIDSQIHVLLGKGDGTFTAGPVTNLNRSEGLLVADFNQDGIPDVGLANVGQIIYGRGDGTFSAPIPTNIETSPTAFVADLDGDGIPDWITSQGALYEGNGFGIFTPFGTIPTDKAVLAASDLNGDSLPDLVVGYTSYSGKSPAAQTILAALQSSAVATEVVVPGTGQRHVFASKKGDATHIGSTSPSTWSIYNIPIGTSTVLRL